MAYRRRNKLTARETRFVCEYLVDRNATQAAIRAGYSARTAGQLGSRLIKRPAVAEVLAKVTVAESAKIGITAERVLRELEALAFSDVSNYRLNDDGTVQLAEGAPPNAMKAVQSIKHRVYTDKGGGTTRTVELKLWDKPAPLRLAGRHVGLFPDRVDDDRVEELAQRMMQRQLERVRAQLEAERQEPIDVTAKEVTP